MASRIRVNGPMAPPTDLELLGGVPELPGVGGDNFPGDFLGLGALDVSGL